MKKTVLLFCVSIVCLGKLQAEAGNLEKPQPLLFVSLGSHCEVAMQIADNQMREAAFPFDWLLTLDYQGFISLFEDDFAFLMERSYLYQHPVGNIINTKYNIDFRHDWLDMDFEKHFFRVRDQYEKRINRFLLLGKYPGKVYFVRAAFDLAIDPRLPTLTDECTKIDSIHSEALRKVLRDKFPDLDFYLVIINYVEENAPELIGLDRIIEFKVRKEYKKDDYAEIFRQLTEHAK